MSHKDTLDSLIPVKLGGCYEQDLTVEGNALDDLKASADSLLLEMFPDTTTRMIDRWEARLGIPTVETDQLAVRQQRVAAKWRALGGMSVPFFTALAASMGFQITITECVGGNPNVWTVTVLNQQTYQFVAGEAAAGDSLLSWNAQTALEGLFNELKPGTSRIIFAYS